MKREYILLALIIPVSLSLIFTFTSISGNNQVKYTAELYYSPTCGCCKIYGDYLKSEGFEVKIRETQNIENIKETLKIPSELWSCHTVKIGKYYVEGHIPIEAIKKLLEEQPNIEGIALPGMPSGSPGMPGEKTEEFVIFAVSKGETKEFMRI